MRHARRHNKDASRRIRTLARDKHPRQLEGSGKRRAKLIDSNAFPPSQNHQGRIPGPLQCLIRLVSHPLVLGGHLPQRCRGIRKRKHQRRRPVDERHEARQNQGVKRPHRPRQVRRRRDVVGRRSHVDKVPHPARGVVQVGGGQGVRHDGLAMLRRRHASLVGVDGHGGRRGEALGPGECFSVGIECAGGVGVSHRGRGPSDFPERRCLLFAVCGLENGPCVPDWLSRGQRVVAQGRVGVAEAEPDVYLVALAHTRQHGLVRDARRGLRRPEEEFVGVGYCGWALEGDVACCLEQLVFGFGAGCQGHAIHDGRVLSWTEAAVSTMLGSRLRH